MLDTLTQRARAWIKIASDEPQPHTAREVNNRLRSYCAADGASERPPSSPCVARCFYQLFAMR